MCSITPGKVGDKVFISACLTDDNKVNLNRGAGLFTGEDKVSDKNQLTVESLTKDNKCTNFENVFRSDYKCLKRSE